ncbi:hypothetical protein I79_026191 [Cricetulus griseus]|uniref:Uncharacterized protein n=1 Tax=Cricetulus griseus TaxID=10029 RepID=G3IQ90_CRIGR|nr:hypothetical protein I79_026191 [Cricetulus griseus]
MLVPERKKREQRGVLVGLFHGCTDEGSGCRSWLSVSFSWRGGVWHSSIDGQDEAQVTLSC